MSASIHGRHRADDEPTTDILPVAGRPVGTRAGEIPAELLPAWPPDGDFTETSLRPVQEPATGWWRTDTGRQLAGRLRIAGGRLVLAVAVVALIVIGGAVDVLVAAALWSIQPHGAAAVATAGALLIGLGIYLLLTREESMSP